MIDKDTYLHIDDNYSYHGEGRMIPGAIDASLRLNDRIDNGRTIVSVNVRKRRRQLTLAERYALYKAKCDKMQEDVNRRAAENPEELLYNMYTNVSILMEQFASHEYLDLQGCPRYEGEAWKKTEIEKLCEEFEEAIAREVKNASR